VFPKDAPVKTPLPLAYGFKIKVNAPIVSNSAVTVPDILRTPDSGPSLNVPVTLMIDPF